MRGMLAGCLVALLSAAGAARAADDTSSIDALLEACTACHGVDGISVSADVPNLAGQRVPYLEAQLHAFRDDTRENDFMTPIAGQLGDGEIAELAAHFGNLPGAKGKELAELKPTSGPERIKFPKHYKEEFTHYLTTDFPERPQIREYFADAKTVAAARARETPPYGATLLIEIYRPKTDASGKLLKDAEGALIPDELVTYSVMQRGEGWGADVPAILRNEDWEYVFFTPERKPDLGVNYAKCFACHRGVEARHYIFTLPQLVMKLKEAK